MDKEEQFIELAADLIKMIGKNFDEIEKLSKQVEELERTVICLNEK